MGKEYFALVRERKGTVMCGRPPVFLREQHSLPSLVGLKGPSRVDISAYMDSGCSVFV